MSSNFVKIIIIIIIIIIITISGFNFCKKIENFVKVSTIRFNQKRSNTCNRINENKMLMQNILVKSRKFYIKRNNNKVDSIEKGRIIIAYLLP